MVTSSNQQYSHRLGNSLLLPLVNVSGKGNCAKVELRETVPQELKDSEAIVSAPELGNMRNVRVVD